VAQVVGVNETHARGGKEMENKAEGRLCRGNERERRMVYGVGASTSARRPVF